MGIAVTERRRSGSHSDDSQISNKIRRHFSPDIPSIIRPVPSIIPPLSVLPPMFNVPFITATPALPSHLPLHYPVPHPVTQMSTPQTLPVVTKTLFPTKQESIGSRARHKSTIWKPYVH